jgi:hypothetical protein
VVTVTALLLVPFGVRVVEPRPPLDGSTMLIVHETPAVRFSVNDPSFLEVVFTVVSPVAVAVTKAHAMLAFAEVFATP